MKTNISKSYFIIHVFSQVSATSQFNEAETQQTEGKIMLKK